MAETPDAAPGAPSGDGCKSLIKPGSALATIFHGTCYYHVVEQRRRRRRGESERRRSALTVIEFHRRLQRLPVARALLLKRHLSARLLLNLNHVIIHRVANQGQRCFASVLGALQGDYIVRDPPADRQIAQRTVRNARKITDVFLEPLYSRKKTDKPDICRVSDWEC